MPTHRPPSRCLGTARLTRDGPLDSVLVMRAPLVRATVIAAVGIVGGCGGSPAYRGEPHAGRGGGVAEDHADGDCQRALGYAHAPCRTVPGSASRSSAAGSAR